MSKVAHTADQLWLDRIVESSKGRSERMKGNRNIILVACAGRKQQVLSPAKDLYTSTLFKASRRYAERCGDVWYILSARYGLVHPDQVLEPYNSSLAEMPRAARTDWSQRVFEALRATVLSGTRDQVVFLAGRHYRAHLEGLLRAFGYRVAVPMQGLGIGQQIQWLNRQLAQ